MPCYHPMLMYPAATRSPKGKRPLTFNPTKGFSDKPVKIPCGECDGCKLEKSRQWAVRCMHEAQMHEQNCFLTLTYNNENLPSDGSLSKTILQKFFKDLRNYLEKERLEFSKIFKREVKPTEIKYYACGEYGEKFSRPHYHACLFGYDFPDKVVVYAGDHSEYKNKIRVNEHQLCRSEILEKLWPYGFSSIGELNMQTAGYVARYVTKKQKCEQSSSYYNGRLPEFAIMSRRPGIGASWFEKYKTDVYPKDFFTVNGNKMRPPRYYDNLLEKKDSGMLADIKIKRDRSAYENEESLVRLTEREKYKKIVTKTLRRDYEQS